MEGPVKRVVTAAEDLLQSLQFDEQGAMVGGKWMGGNGGLISSATTQKADELRRAIHALRQITY